MADRIEYQSVRLDVKQLTESGTFEGYASIFNTADGGMDIILPGAFTDTLQRRGLPKLLWQHDQSEPIGLFEHAEEDDRGLFVRGRLLTEVRRAKEALALLRAGAVDGLSIGYRARDFEIDRDGVRRISSIDLFEVSLVTIPMQDQALVSAVKSADGIATIRDLEHALRDAGWSRKSAQIVCAKFEAKADRRDSELAELGGLLRANIQILQGELQCQKK